MNRLLAFLEERLGAVVGWRAFADRRVPGGVRLQHVFAPLLVYLFVQAAVLGIAMATYYSPSSTDAWASTAYLQDRVTLGWFVRGLHYHTASAFVVVAAAWLVVLACTRSYRRPFEVTWLAAIAMVGLGLAFGLSGNPLPWDQQGYWGIQVELGVAEQTPGGGAIRTLIQGGSDAGNFTLLRLYVIHVFLLPVAFVLVMALVRRQVRVLGHAAPAGMTSERAERTAQRYFPAQAFLDVLAMTVVGAALVGLTVATHGAELFGPADPTDNFQARPEWYFMFLYKLRMYFEGPLEPIATVVIPGAAVTFLVAVPLIDRFAGRAGRLVVLGGVGALMTGVMLLTGVALMADEADEEYQKALVQAQKVAAQARTYAQSGVVPLGGPAVFWNDPEYQTKQLYKEHCQNCHTVDGVGGEEGPALTDYSSRRWLSELVRDANAPAFFGNTAHKDEMESYPESDLPQQQLEAVVEYLVSLMGDEEMVVDEALASRGKALWDDELDCNACHEVEVGEDSDGPTLALHGSQAWVERVIRDSSKPDLFGKRAEMPKFEGKLTDEEIERLAAYVVAQRHRAAE